MATILTVGQERDLPRGLPAALEKYDDISISNSESGQKALDMLSEQPVDLTIVSEKLEDMSSFEFAEKMVLINPMINCALTSSMSADDFHEASEGLGVLGRLDVEFGEKQLEELMKSLRKVINSNGEPANDN